jgi:hypothetical protein
MSNKWVNISIKSLLGLTFLFTLLRMSREFLRSYSQQNIEDGQFFGFTIYLLNWLLVFGFVWLLAWLNYKFIFLKLMLKEDSKSIIFYWIWIIGLLNLTLLFFEWQSDFEVDFFDESIISSLVLVGFIVIFAFIADYFRSKREQLELLKQKADAELGMLKAQINPHFLFNCLNLVYSSAFREGADETAETVQKLSSILRFSVEESKREQTSVEKELDFINKYTSLQVARLPKKEHIRTQIHIESDETPAVIVPLLIVPFIENAFQHAVSTEQPTFIEIDLTVIKKKLHLLIQNSIPNKMNPSKKGTGTGIENTKKRLNLIYPNRHELKINHQKDTFSVDLTINL